jgi:protease I
VTLLSISGGQIQAMNSDIEPAEKFDVDSVVADVRAADFDALILPGGTVNPDKLRLDEAAVSFVRDMFAAGKPVGVICHGPVTLVEADVVRGGGSRRIRASARISATRARPSWTRKW